MRWHQRAFLKVYVPLWALWFRLGRRPLSWLVDRFRPRVSLPPRRFDSPESFAHWWREHTRWRSDPLKGAFDVIASLAYAQWQWREKGVFEDDCDGLAYVAAQHVRLFADGGRCYVVTLLLNPFDFSSLWEGLQMGAHVLCIFPYQGRWYVLSNNEIFPQTWATFSEALEENPYTRGHTILWYEVRDPHMGLLAVNAPPEGEVYLVRQASGAGEKVGAAGASRRDDVMRDA